MEHTRVVDNELYTRKALTASREAYRAFCSVRAEPIEPGRVAIAISVGPEHASEARRIVLEFWNYFLDTACQSRLEEA